MSTLPLLDYALSSNRIRGAGQRRKSNGQLTQFAESIVKSVLDEIDGVSLFEKSVENGKPDEHDFTFDRDIAVLVRYSYEECIKQAEQVLQRVNRLEQRGYKIKGAEKLRDEQGRLSAMLSVSLEDVDEAMGHASQGKVRSLGELRNELQARLHK